MEKHEENAGVCRAGEIKMSLPKSRLIFLDLLSDQMYFLIIKKLFCFKRAYHREYRNGGNIPANPDKNNIGPGFSSVQTADFVVWLPWDAAVCRGSPGQWITGSPDV